jgi:hypothetical protein
MAGGRRSVYSPGSRRDRRRGVPGWSDQNSEGREPPEMQVQSIAGVVPPSVAEATIMMVWPSVAATAPGRLLGRLAGIRAGFGPLTLGRLIAIGSIPLAAALYFSMRLPWAIRRYRLTNRRVTIEEGVQGTVQQYTDLDRFDRIEIEVRPGQEWFPAGDLVFLKGGVETLRLAGVPRPEVFRQACLKVRQSYLSVDALTAALSS